MRQLLILFTCICPGLFLSCREETPHSHMESIANPSAVHGKRILRVCWVSGEERYQAWLNRARDIVAAEWEEKTVVSFVGWQPCIANDEAEIKIKFIDRYRPVSCVGDQSCDLKESFQATMILSPSYYSKFFSCHPGWFFIDSWGQKSCYRHQVLHEFGHALGLLHEQDRYDSQCTYPGTNGEPYAVEPMGPYDAKSIMNYCYSTLHISPLDAAAINSLYLRKTFDYWGRIRSTDGQCLSADHDSKLVPELSLKACQETRSQLWGLRQRGQLVSFSTASDPNETLHADDNWCLHGSVDDLDANSQTALTVVPCDSESQRWSYSEESGQFLTMGISGDFLSLGVSADTKTPTLSSNSIQISEIGSGRFEDMFSVSWSWQGMIKSVGSNFILYPSQGGLGGQSFDDRSMLDLNDLPAKLLIRAGDRIDAIGFVYKSGKKLIHGGLGGDLYELNLQPYERINWLQTAVAMVDKNKRVVGIKLVTSEGQQLSLGSFPPLANYFSYSMRPDQTIFGFYGRSGKEIDQLGVYATP